MPRKFIVGSRASTLAIIQTQAVIKQLKCDLPIQKIMTKGDKIHNIPLAKIDGKGFFTREIDNALLRREIDFAVHSYKDIPTSMPQGIVIACVPPRESPIDALVSTYSKVQEIQSNARIGTSSIRRKALVLHLLPNARVTELRGNITTRIQKLRQGFYDAIIVAEAGLKRLGYLDYHPLDPVKFIPASCQGALAVCARFDDTEVLEFLEKIEDPLARLSCECERDFLSAMGGGCHVPAGVYSQIDTKKQLFKITGFVSSPDGKTYIQRHSSGKINNAKTLTKQMISSLYNAGARAIISTIEQGQ